MKLSPRYDGPVVATVDGDPADQLAPVTRQRRRFQAMLTELTEDQWHQPSRCDGWSVRDVVAHLVTVNGFWSVSIVSGLAGEPTRVLADFDPAATPPAFVDAMSSLSPDAVLDQFVETNDALLATLAGLTADQWLLPAESPAGHVPIHLVAQHALWDCWIHERDVAIPLGLTPAVEADEVTECLRYAAMVGPTLAVGAGRSDACVLAVEATDPSVRFVLDVGECVALRDQSFDREVACLRGDAVALVEALTLRAPMSPSAPVEWIQLLSSLSAAFDAA